jgi:ABC-type glycerol-3-phosphate transport system substrate-binding protein
MCRTKDAPPLVDKTEKQIVVYDLYDNEEAFQALIQKYVEKSPYVKIVYKNFNDFGEYEKAVLDGLAEGAGPDIFAMPNNWFVKNRKKLTPMPVSMGTKDDFASAFVDVASKDLVTTDDNGILQVYGMPLYIDTLALYYNNDQFEDRLPSKGRPSYIWDGIKNDVYVLTKSSSDSLKFEVAGIGMGVSKNVTNAVDVLYALMIQYGTVFYDSLMSQCTISSTNSTGMGASEALDLFVSFAGSQQKHYSWNEYMENDFSAFAAGRVSMVFGYASDYPKILAARTALKNAGTEVIAPSSIKVAPFPQLEDPSVSTNKRYTYAKYMAFGVSRNTKYSEAAWDFLTFLTSPESQKSYFDATHRPTSRRDLIASQKMDPFYGSFVEQIGYAESFPVVDVLKYDEWFEDAIDQVASNKSARNIITQVQDAISAMLPKNGYVVPVNTKYYEELEKQKAEN